MMMEYRIMLIVIFMMACLCFFGSIRRLVSTDKEKYITFGIFFLFVGIASAIAISLEGQYYAEGQYSTFSGVDYSIQFFVLVLESGYLFHVTKWGE